MNNIKVTKGIESVWDKHVVEKNSAPPLFVFT